MWVGRQCVTLHGTELALFAGRPFYVQQADGSLREARGDEDGEDVAVYDADDFLIPARPPAPPQLQRPSLWRLPSGGSARGGRASELMQPCPDPKSGAAGTLSAYASALPRGSWVLLGGGGRTGAAGGQIPNLEETLYIAVAGEEIPGPSHAQSLGLELRGLGEGPPRADLPGGDLCGEWEIGGGASGADSRVTSQTPLTARAAGMGAGEEGEGAFGVGFHVGAASGARMRWPLGGRARSALTRWLHPRWVQHF